MTVQTKKRIRLIYGIVLTAVTIIAGLCLMYGCYSIYTDGLAAGSSQIYSRDIIATTFAGIAIPVYACLALVIGSFVLNIVLPPEKEKLVPEKNHSLILQRLQQKKSFSPDQIDLQAAVEHQQKQRKLHVIISLCLIAVCAVVFLIPACRSSYWPNATDPDRTVADAMAGIMPLFATCVLIPIGYTIFTAYFCRNSIRKEIELWKQASAPATVVDQPDAPFLSEKAMLVIRLALVALAVAGIIAGVAGGGVEAIIAKAVAICTECIGLG